MRFSIWNKDLEFDTRTKEIKYKNLIFTPDVRTFGDIKDLYQKWDKIEDDFGMYYMYRWLYLSEDDKKVFEKNNMRYDITILVPKIISLEHNKTFGHFHPKNSSWKHFKEIYEVLEWSCIYLQQNKKEVFYTNAFPWDKVIMRDWFWHVSINPSWTEYLIMADISDSTFESNYDEYKNNSWANFLYKTWWWEKNPNYKNDLEIKEDFDKFWEVMNIYDDFLSEPSKYNFLH